MLGGKHQIGNHGYTKTDDHGGKQRTLINKIDTRMETMFKEFQTYLMRSTTELVQSLQSNKQHPINNAASHVYDETMNSVARANNSHNKSSQAQVH